MLLPTLADPPDAVALRFPERSLTYAELRDAAAGVAGALDGVARVALWTPPVIETPVAAVGALLAGAAIVPLNTKSGPRELEHVLRDAAPEAVLAPPGAELPDELGGLPRIAPDLDAPAADLPPEPPEDAIAYVAYTSGTTGPPKGALLPRRALAANLDALAAAWAWTAADEVVHALPLFHVHGGIVATLGPLRRGGTSRHLGRFDPAEAARALDTDRPTVLMAVPTMYHRIAAAIEVDPAIGDGFRAARLLISGSAALPAAEHERLERLTGQRVVERYGMTETLMIAGVRADGERRPGHVGLPFDGVEVRLVGEEPGEVQVRSTALFDGYLDRPDATQEAFTDDGWFRTGDLGVLADDGYLRLVGRASTDLIKSGGFKVGAGEIEGALLEHPGVAEVAVTGEPDEDLGERIVAWVVDGDEPATDDELTDHVARLLTPHKRPRAIRRLEALPRNALGKVVKSRLAD